MCMYVCVCISNLLHVFMHACMHVCMCTSRVWSGMVRYGMELYVMIAESKAVVSPSC